MEAAAEAKRMACDTGQRDNAPTAKAPVRVSMQEKCGGGGRVNIKRYGSHTRLDQALTSEAITGASGVDHIVDLEGELAHDRVGARQQGGQLRMDGVLGGHPHGAARAQFDEQAANARALLQTARSGLDLHSLLFFTNIKSK